MDIFSALSDRNRRNIIELLALNGRLSASDISDKFKVSPSAISQHLKVLKEAELVEVEKRAQQRIYTINTSAIQELEGWLGKLKQNWEAKLDRMELVLEQEKRRMKK